MTGTQTVDAFSGAPAEATRRRRRWPLMIGVIVAVLVVAGVASVAVIARHDDAAAYAAPQIGWMNQGCQQWADDERAANTSRPDNAWCSSMASWMNSRVSQGQTGPMMGQGQMMGSTMWQSPEAMRATCERWAKTNSTGETGTDSSAWCAQMVTWMTQHMGDWNGWMTNGPMMAGRTPPTT